MNTPTYVPWLVLAGYAIATASLVHLTIKIGTDAALAWLAVAAISVAVRLGERHLRRNP